MVTPSVTAASKGPLTSRQQTKLVLQPLDQQWQPSTNNYYPAITTISSEARPNGDDRVFVETFLIDAVSAPNKKGWRVSYDNPEDFDSRVQASKNHPLVLFQTPHPTKDGEMIFDHPVAPITSLEAAADPLRATIEFQKRYTIGYARHFKKVKDGIWHAVYEITNAKAKRFFQKAKEKGLKLFTSPHIVRPASEPDRKNIREWALIHNAIVSNPAHDEAIASIKDVKAVNSRYPVDFNNLFASLDSPDDDDESELDAGFLLEIYTNQLAITSHDNNSEIVTNMAESASINAVTTPPEANLTSPQLNTATNFNPVTNQTEETKIPQSSGPKEVSQNTVDNNQQQQKQEEQQQKQQGNSTEIEQLKAQLESLQKQNQDLQAKYAQDQRKAQIEKLFAPVVGQLYADPKTGILNEKEYNTEVSRLTKSNHTVDEISELIQARYIMAQYNSAKDPKNRQERASSFTSQETESASIPYTKMSTTTTAIARNDDSHTTLGLAVLRKIQGGLL